LSRIDPSLLGVKDGNGGYPKNALYLHGVSSAPLLCISVVLVTGDSLQNGRIIGPELREFVMKDIAGVMLAMELERFVAVLGLTYSRPHVPDDDARRAGDLLHFTMVQNAFCFTTTLMGKSGESFYIYIGIIGPH
jgi:hypothetical protein